jgi:2-amino-4-hydroxy-6-hydroxymethyldihydropteridine diphosphokinase
MTGSVQRVALSLGSNMGNRYELFRSALGAIGAIDGVMIIAMSRIEETEAFGPPQPNYLNQMLLVDTTLTMPALLSHLQLVELSHGRARSVPKGPRTLDIDIVWAKGITVTTSELLIPHPGLTDRVFWQGELAELVGVVEAAEAIAAAQVHAGMDTLDGVDGRQERRWSGGWDPVT